MSDKKETIYYALSVPGDDPPDYSMSIDDENSEIEAANQDGNGGLFGSMMQWLNNINAYLAIVNKQLDSLVQRINSSKQENEPVPKNQAPSKRANNADIQRPVGYASPSVSPPLKGADSEYGLDDDPSLDEWMFFDLMDDD